MTRRCAVCRATFEPRQSFQTWCGVEHASVIAAQKLAKAKTLKAIKERKETRAKLDKLKTRAQWAKETQAAVNAFVRLRDADKPCISCGRHHQGQYHAGHYLSVGARPELRFTELNIHKQCAPCNTHLSGNAVMYRIRLIEKIGTAGVEWLEGPHPAQHHTTADLKAIKAEYAAKTKQMKAQSCAL